MTSNSKLLQNAHPIRIQILLDQIFRLIEEVPAHRNVQHGLVLEVVKDQAVGKAGFPGNLTDGLPLEPPFGRNMLDCKENNFPFSYLLALVLCHRTAPLFLINCSITNYILTQKKKSRKNIVTERFKTQLEVLTIAFDNKVKRKK